jgi:hypothetical protein
MTEPSGPEESAGSGRFKLDRLIDRYELGGLGAELEARWLGEGDFEGEGLRALATLVNHRLLQAALERAGAPASMETVRGRYTRLTDDSVTSGQRTQARRALRRVGVDVERLERDFLTRSSVHRYLRDGRGASKEPPETDQVASTRETVARFASKLQAVTSTQLDRLASGDRVTLGSTTTIVEVRVVCESCGTSQTVAELLDAGGCACE